jgi:hypothetical protein
MKKRIFHIVLLLIAQISYGQNLPSTWVSGQKTADSCVFKFKNLKLTINGIPTTPSKSAALAIFANNGKTYECVGYHTIIGDSATIKTYAHDSTNPNGYSEGADYRILYWDLTGCQKILAWDSSKTTLVRTGHAFIVDSLFGFSTWVFYSPTTFSKSGTDPFPNNSDGVPVRFTSSGLLVDSSNGRINLRASPLGTATIKFTSDYCLLIDSAVVTITDSVKKTAPDSVSIHVIPPTCSSAGTIIAKVIGDTAKIWTTFELENTNTGTTYSNKSGIFDNLSDGKYGLSVLNDTNGRYDYPDPLIIARPEDCNNPIIAPDSKNGMQTLYIKDQGAGKILDSQGQLVKEMSLPGEWEGLDNKGNPVPMGDYYLFINGKQNKIITVIR